MKKRMISALLVLCMVFSLMPATAFATETDSTTCEHTYNNGRYVMCEGNFHMIQCDSCDYFDSTFIPCSDDDGDGYCVCSRVISGSDSGEDDSGDSGDDTTTETNCASITADGTTTYYATLAEAAAAVTEGNTAYQLDENGQLVKKAECTCETKCAEGSVNGECAACVADYTACTVEEAPVVATNNIDAAAMTADELKAAVDAALAAGYTAITVNLAENADATMFTAITAALAATVDQSLDSWELTQLTGTIDLTISGAETVPAESFCMNEYANDNYRAGAALRSVTLTDATTIGESAFFGCLMTSISAPKAVELGYGAMSGCYQLADVYLPSVQTIGGQAFAECSVLETISLPECTTVGAAAFWWCSALTTVYAPKATNLGAIEFKLCTSLTKVTLGSVESVYQKFESIDDSLFSEANDTTNIELILACDQKALSFDSSTRYWTAGTEAFDFTANSFIGYTFKSITAEHTPEADDGDCTTAVKCSVCGETVVDAKESHTGGTATCSELAKCEVCGTSYGEYAPHSTTATGDEAATCTTLAYCSVCQSEYGEVDADNHSFVNGKCECGVEVDASITVDGTTTYYATLAEAAAAVTEGQTIVLLDDVTVAEGETLAFNAWADLEAGEHTVTCSGTVTIGESAGIIFENELYYYGGDANQANTHGFAIGCDDLLGITYWKAGDGYAICTPASGETSAVLELHNVEITYGTGSTDNPAIRSDSSLTILFYGKNSVSTEVSNYACYVLYVPGTVTLIGMDPAATLTLASGGRYGIDVKTLKVESGTVNVSTVGGTGTYAIQASNGVTVEPGAVVNVTFGEVTGGGISISCGLVAPTIVNEGTINGLALQGNTTTVAYTAYGSTVLAADFTPFTAEGITTTFVVPEGATLTVNEGVTLDLSGLAAENIDISGTVVNNGTVTYPEGFSSGNEPAEITGVSITVDGVTYTGGNVTIYDTSTVSFTVSGTNFANLSTDNRLLYYMEGFDDPVTASCGYTIDTEANTAVADYSKSLQKLSYCSNSEVKYSNDDGTTWTGTGIYLTYAETDPVSITRQPANVTAKLGEKIEFTVEAEGDGLTYQWYYKFSSHEEFSASSFKRSTYSVSMTNYRNGLSVYCVVTDQYGNSVTSDTAMACIPLEITQQPQDVQVEIGQTARIGVEATGYGLQYQWYYKNRSAAEFTKSGYTGKSYSMTMAEFCHGRQVYCVITDAFGNTVTTDTATMSRPPIELVILTQPQNVEVDFGEKARIDVEVQGEGLQYQWYYKNLSGTEFKASAFTRSYYAVNMAGFCDGRQVYCVITDQYGNTVTTDTATMYSTYQALAILTQPEDTEVNMGERFSVTVEAQGSGLRYQWYYKNAGDSGFKVSAFKGDTYAMTLASWNDGRQVYCVITDRNGNTVTTETVTISNAENDTGGRG